jgi:drug/metabolite transporter (DMT)-like permease
MKRMSTGEWGLLVILGILWGGSFFFQKVALVALPPFTVLLARVGLAAATLWIAARAAGHRLPPLGRPWAPFVGHGHPQQRDPVQPHPLGPDAHRQRTRRNPQRLRTALHRGPRPLPHPRRALTRRRAAGVLLGLGGVVIMIGPDSLGGLGRDVLAQLGVLAAGVSYACAGIFGRRFAGTPPLVTATGQVTASTLLILPVALLVDRPWTLAPPPTRVCAAILGLAIISTALGYVVYFRILATAGATNLLLVTLLMPAIALVLGTLVLGRAPRAPPPGRHGADRRGACRDRRPGAGDSCAPGAEHALRRGSALGPERRPGAFPCPPAMLSPSTECRATFEVHAGPARSA